MNRYSVFALTSEFPFDKALKMFKRFFALALLTMISWAGGCNQPAASPSKNRDQAEQSSSSVNATGAAQEVKSSGGSGSK